MSPAFTTVGLEERPRESQPNYLLRERERQLHTLSSGIQSLAISDPSSLFCQHHFPEQKEKSLLYSTLKTQTLELITLMEKKNQ